MTAVLCFCCCAGSSLEEMRQLAACNQNVVPVRLSGRRLELLDLEAPFLFRGRKRYYGSDVNLSLVKMLD